MNDFNRTRKLFAGPMTWIEMEPRRRLQEFGIVKITKNGVYDNWHFGLTLIGDK